MTESLVYTVAEAAEAIGLAQCRVYDLCHVATFPAFRIGGRWIIPRRDLEEWLSQQVREKGGAVD